MPPRRDIPREEWSPHRPLILQPDGSMCPYERASSFGDVLEDTNNLWLWKIRNTMIGLLSEDAEDLQMLVTTADPDTREGKRTLNSVAGKAQHLAGGEKAANRGTALHAAMEAVDKGQEPKVPPRFRKDVDAYRTVMARSGFEVVYIEEFVVCDEIRVAGTFDKAVRCPDGKIRIVDFKTGKWGIQFGGDRKFGIQLTSYTHARLYDPGTGERSIIHPDLDPSTGYIVSLPAGTGEATVYELDLEKAWEGAKAVKWVLDTWRNTSIATVLEQETLS